MRRTLYQTLSSLGAPDGVLTALTGLLVIIALSPWLDVSIAGVALNDTLPAWVSLISGVGFLLFLIPFIPVKVRDQKAHEELQHRFRFISRHIDRDSALISDAVQVIRAIDGQGGEFKPSHRGFEGIPIEALSNQAGCAGLAPYIDSLREESRNVPRSHEPGEEVPDPTRHRFKEVTVSLLEAAAQQGALPDARTSRR